MKQSATAGVQNRSEQYARWALILVVLFSLVVIVATRFTAPVPSVATVHAGCEKAAQRMNQDAIGWFAPILQIALLLPPVFNALRPEQDRLIANPFFEQNLYNRPPPLL
jgi:hypothetical protein